METWILITIKTDGISKDVSVQSFGSLEEAKEWVNYFTLHLQYGDGKDTVNDKDKKKYNKAMTNDDIDDFLFDWSIEDYLFHIRQLDNKDKK